VGVTDGGGTVGEGAVAGGDGVVDDFACRAGDGDLGAVEAHAAHVDRDRAAALGDADLDESSRGVEGEGLLFHQAAVVEVTGEDPDAVAAFFGLGGVGVEDAQGEGSAGGGQRSPENAVGADAEVAVADAADVRGRRQRAGVARVHDDVVVAKGVVFGEAHGEKETCSHDDDCWARPTKAGNPGRGRTTGSGGESPKLFVRRGEPGGDRSGCGVHLGLEHPIDALDQLWRRERLDEVGAGSQLAAQALGFGGSAAADYDDRDLVEPLVVA